jgi:hypothetical protein
MGYTTTPKNLALDTIGGQASYLSFHTGNPGATGANEVTGGTYTRPQTTWQAAANAAKAGSEVTANIPAGRTITHWGLWTAASGGTFYFGDVLAAAEAFGGAGTFDFTPTLTQAG